ncbi:PD-(D/E)XK nuclease family transposase [Niabella drilacis]|uniref:PD-(D/E)XK nuclease family transposase n=2 Tax=Niabella drilacis (strain DSM 25811 / CCM 8410 / CCUG 62505 / LMG 26954 / E90) TaxID=1285928 RepID=A0A1G6U0C9_NIADE|nr:PD-(D/E)XK nuclease family transposase [Niabella drilacis]
MKTPAIAPIGRYIDPLTDFGFKRIFGSEAHKRQLVSFLNALFKGRKLPQEHSGPAKHYRKAVFDVSCRGNSWFCKEGTPGSGKISCINE